MDCSICYSEISKETGKVELSCSHSFHFSCIAKWFDKERLGGMCESCPLCRHNVTEFEKMPDLLMEEEEEEEDEVNQENIREETREQALERMQRESVAVGNAITGPVGVWRKTRYGTWIMVSQRN